jgi:cobalt-zinc-cadmium efflux system membrane fusion protein
MFARAVIVLGPSNARALVPRESLQRAEDVQLVFVALAPDRYEARRVRTGSTLGDLVEILDGIEPGERVAVRGSFLLKTETLRGSIGAGCCEVE